jgi:hypothetical protein
MQLLRPGIIGAAVLLALHVFMLAGVDIGHPRPAVAIAVDHGEDHHAPVVARWVQKLERHAATW